MYETSTRKETEDRTSGGKDRVKEIRKVWGGTYWPKWKNNIQNHSGDPRWWETPEEKRKNVYVWNRSLIRDDYKWSCCEFRPRLTLYRRRILVRTSRNLSSELTRFCSARFTSCRLCAWLSSLVLAPIAVPTARLETFDRNLDSGDVTESFVSCSTNSGAKSEREPSLNDVFMHGWWRCCWPGCDNVASSTLMLMCSSSDGFRSAEQWCERPLLSCGVDISTSVGATWWSVFSLTVGWIPTLSVSVLFSPPSASRLNVAECGGKVSAFNVAHACASYSGSLRYLGSLLRHLGSSAWTTPCLADPWLFLQRISDVAEATGLVLIIPHDVKWNSTLASSLHVHARSSRSSMLSSVTSPRSSVRVLGAATTLSPLRIRACSVLPSVGSSFLLYHTAGMNGVAFGFCRARRICRTGLKLANVRPRRDVRTSVFDSDPAGNDGLVLVRLVAPRCSVVTCSCACCVMLMTPRCSLVLFLQFNIGWHSTS